MASAQGPLGRSALFDVVTPDMRAEMASRVGEDQALRYAAGRLVWRLSHLGEVCVGPKLAGEQGYVLRSFWLPELPFPELDPDTAARALTLRYLACNGPATPKDVAHFFGTKVTTARGWFADLGPDLVAVACGHRADLFIPEADLDDLRTDEAPGAARLLAAYDTRLMAHADKSWIAEDAERSAVWKRSAVVSAVVLAGGRIVGTWTHHKRAKRVDVAVVRLSGWSDAHLPAVKEDANRLAAHLERAEANVVLS